MADDLTEALGKNIPLSEMIESLRQELAVAIHRGKGKSVRFEIESAEIEVQLVASKTKEVGGGLKFWVISAEGKAGMAETTTHRLKLSLKPKGLDGRPLEASR